MESMYSLSVFAAEILLTSRCVFAPSVLQIFLVLAILFAVLEKCLAAYFLFASRRLPPLFRFVMFALDYIASAGGFLKVRGP